MKIYRLPLPESLLTDDDPEVELRVTLSYFTEPNKFGRRTYHGLDLKWDCVSCIHAATRSPSACSSFRIFD